MSDRAKKFLDLIPSAFASRAFGALSEVHFPAEVQKRINKAFATIAGINVEEAKHPIDSYDTLNGFFTRELKPEARPLANASVVSPVDGCLSAFGVVTNDTMLTVKKQHFNVDELVGTNAAHDWLINSQYFIIYLSPANYHRIHAPLTASITHMSYVPGRLLPVNRIGLALTDELFPTNERLTTFFKTASGRHVALVKVGATCVGKISVTYDACTTNTSEHRSPIYKAIEPNPLYKCGQEVGTFNLGSTVILFVEGTDFTPWTSIYEGMKIKLGDGLGDFS